MKTSGALILSVVMLASDTTASPARNVRSVDMAASGQKGSAIGGFLPAPDTQSIPDVS
jgi:hypothetical protein